MTQTPLYSTDLYPGKISVLGKKWYLQDSNERTALDLSQRFDLSLPIAEILTTRGVTFETAASYLAPTLRSLMPDPSHLKDCNQAVSRIMQALHQKEKICIFADYDVDGATSSALWRRYFRDIGCATSLYIPDRIDEGYGPNSQAMELLKKQGIQLVIMVDCGTTSFDPLETARQCGLDVIVVDHHTAQPLLPPCVALVNPNRLDETSPLTTLCAAGVSFMVIAALQRALREAGYFKGTLKEPDLRLYMDLVALGTVCDVMPLTGLNRAFVSQGLKIFKNRENIGLAALSDIAGVSEALTAYHLGFLLGPRINAGGRVGQADLGSRLLTTLDPIEAKQIAQQLNVLNQERQAIEAQVTEEAFLEIERLGLHENPLIVVKGIQWHPGVIGIVASRIKEKFNRPACVVSFDEKGVGKGSGRSITGVHLGTAMHAARQKNLLVHGGGHAMAAGFTVTHDCYDSFYTFLQGKLAQQVALTTPSLYIDSALNLSGATEVLVDSLALLEPFGSGNPTPKFSLSYVKIAHAEKVGATHIRCRLKSQEGSYLKGMAFRAVDTPLGNALLAKKDCLFHVAITLKLDTWSGRREVVCFIEDLMLV